MSSANAILSPLIFFLGYSHTSLSTWHYASISNPETIEGLLAQTILLASFWVLAVNTWVGPNRCSKTVSDLVSVLIPACRLACHEMVALKFSAWPYDRSTVAQRSPSPSPSLQFVCRETWGSKKQQDE